MFRSVPVGYSYRIEVLDRDMRVNTHMIKEERYLLPLLRVLNRTDKDAVIVDRCGNVFSLKNMLSQIEGVPM